MLGRELLDDPGVLGRGVPFFLGVGLKVEQLPIILGVLFIESPLFPTDRNQVPSFGVPGSLFSQKRYS